jgi:CHAD domain-containing protein
MSYAFRNPGRPVGKSVRRIARERLEASLSVLADPSPALPVLVHELRKNVKRTRGLLRLVRPVFPGYDAENAALRDAARLLAGLRDRSVLLDTFDSLAPEADLPAEVRAALRTQLTEAHTAPADPGAILAAHGEAVAAALGRTADWEIDAKGFDALADGLARSWRAARKAMKLAAASDSAEALHRWRKRIKDHWYHATLLEPIWPGMIRPHVAIAGELGETLGTARDLALLAHALDGRADAEPLRALAMAREAELLAAARTTGALFLAEDPEHLADRWRHWWNLRRRQAA